MYKNFQINAKDKMAFDTNKTFLETCKIESNVFIELIDEHNNLKDYREIHNTVKDYGLYGVMECLLAAPSSPGKPTHMEVGTGTGGTTKLNSHLDGRVALTSKTRSNAVVTMVGTFAAGVSTGAITEAGIFDSAVEDSVGMYLYSSFDVINKGALDSLVITWTFTVAAA